MTPFLTIITPVYNRATLIKNLYESLCKQTNYNFIWLVIDDGSKDEVDTVIDTFQKVSPFPIEFYKKENGGKHTALNLAFSKLSTELTIIVDSDDTLLPEAVETIYDVWQNRMDKEVAGCIFLKGYTETQCIGHSELPNGTYDMIEMMFKYRIDGDKFNVFRSDILNQYRFPEFEGEKYVGESYVWNQIYLKYPILYENKILYLCEYLEDGLTKQGRKLRILSPLGGMEYSKIHFNKRFPLKERVKRAWLFVCYGKFAKLNFREIVSKTESRSLVVVNYCFGLLLYHYWRLTVR